MVRMIETIGPAGAPDLLADAEDGVAMGPLRRRRNGRRDEPGDFPTSCACDDDYWIQTGRSERASKSTAKRYEFEAHS